MEQEAFREQVQQLVEENRLADAIEVLRKAGKEVSALKSRLTDFNDQQALGTLSREQQSLTRNRIAVDILYLLKHEPDSGTGSLLAPATSPTLYEQVVRKLKNNVWVVGILLAFAVAFAVVQFGGALNGLFPPPPADKAVLVMGVLTEASPPHAPLAGAKIFIDEEQIISRADGSFEVGIALKGEQLVNFSFTHEGFVSATRVYRVSSDQDTFRIQEAIQLVPKEEKSKNSSSGTQAITSKKTTPTFSLTFRGKSWGNCVLVQGLKQKGYAYTAAASQNKIEIAFPPDAIYAVGGKYKYDASLPPQLTVNGTPCMLPNIQLLHKSQAIGEDALDQFLKTQLQEHLNTPGILDEIMKHL